MITFTTNVAGCKATVEVTGVEHDADVLLRAAHALSGKAFVEIGTGAPGVVHVSIRGKRTIDNPADLAGEFGNHLLDHELRARLRAETESLRRLLIAQAFSQADLLAQTRESEQVGGAVS